MELRRRRLVLAGYGAVGRALTALLAQAHDELAQRYGLAFDVTAVATRRSGLLVTPDGVGPDMLAAIPQGRDTSRTPGLAQTTVSPDLAQAAAPPGPTRAAASHGGTWPDLRSFLADPAAPYDVLVEITTQSPADGEPAATHLRAALGSGHDVVTANKGPIAWHEADLRRIAATTGARLRYEAALMDCLPAHPIRESIVPVGRVVAFAGIVNATTNGILSAMAVGRGAAEALAEAQRSGQAEADPRNDIEGHDAALKSTVLANLLLDPPELLTPASVDRRGLDTMPEGWPAEAAARGARVRLVARGESRGEGPTRTVHVRVAPEELPADDSLAAVGGTAMALRIESEYGGKLQLTLLAGPVQSTAYAILMDLVALERGAGR